MAKHSIASLLPRFNASRMVGEYVSRFYLPASKRGRLYAQKGYENARALASWKMRVRSAWQGVKMQRVDTPKKRVQFGDMLEFEMALNLNGLLPEDVVVEMLISRPNKIENKDFHHYRFEFRGIDPKTGEHRFGMDLAPNLCGRLDYRIRVYPSHPLLTHPLEMGLMAWL